MTTSSEASHGTQNKIYRALCQALSDPLDDLPWRSFRDSEWALLSSMARAHGVAGLLHRAVQSNGWGAAFPPSVLDQLAQAYYRDAAHNQLLFDELARILEALHQAQIPVIVLKGAALAHTLYPDPALRPMNDLDLMVKPEDLFTAISALKQAGYRQQKITYHAVLAGGTQGRVSVELHWLLLPGRHTQSMMDWFWQQIASYEMGGRSVADGYQLDPTASLLYLAAHLGLAHGGERPRLIWCYDIDLLVREKDAEIDWDLLVERASVYGWRESRYGSLAAVHDRFDTPIPVEVLEAFSNNKQKDFSSQADQNMNLQAHFNRTFTRQALGSLGLLERTRAVLGMLFPSKRYMKQKYQLEPGWVWPVNYLRRFVQLLSETGNGKFN